jgi:hypothetical protein
MPEPTIEMSVPAVVRRRNERTVPPFEQMKKRGSHQVDQLLIVTKLVDPTDTKYLN